MKIKDVYPILQKLISENEKSAQVDQVLGTFSFTPQTVSDNGHHIFVFSKKNQTPTNADIEIMTQALYLFLRQFTRETGHVLIKELDVIKDQVGAYGCLFFFWKTTSTAGLLNLNNQESNVTTWWLNLVQNKKDEDKKQIANMNLTAAKPSWSQSSLLN